MRAFLFLLLFLLLSWPAHGHIGSPNVFFDGRAGPYEVRVVIRPPNAIPGPAQIDIRVSGSTAHTIRIQPSFWDASIEAAPAPIGAVATASDPHLFTTSFWLLRRGSHAVRIQIEGSSGTGELVVPLQATLLAGTSIPPGLSAALLILVLVLIFGAILVARATAQRFAPASTGRAVLVAALCLIAGISFASVRWRTMDRNFRERLLARPIPVTATIRSSSEIHRLVVTPVDQASPGQGWDTLVTDHGKLAHLFLLRESDLAAFAHLHPVRRDAQTFESVLPALPAGNYQLYAELTHENGSNDTLTGRVNVPAPIGAASQPSWDLKNDVWCQSPRAVSTNAAEPDALDADDSWHVAPPPSIGSLQTQVSPLMGGGKMVFANAGDFVVDRETALRFAVYSASGEAVPLQSYMGMLGHAVIRRDDGSVFTHLHPAGTISMAAQQIFSGAAPAANLPAFPETSEVTFPYAFPQVGDYHLWIQVRVDGRVATGVFAVRVR